jgi:hypothetical protein
MRLPQLHHDPATRCHGLVAMHHHLLHPPPPPPCRCAAGNGRSGAAAAAARSDASLQPRRRRAERALPGNASGSGEERRGSREDPCAAAADAPVRLFHLTHLTEEPMRGGVFLSKTYAKNPFYQEANQLSAKTSRTPSPEQYKSGTLSPSPLELIICLL